MKYLFALGSNPTLSLAELSSVFKESKIALINNDLALLDTAEFEAAELIKRLGGTIKIAILEKEVKKGSPDLEKTLFDLIATQAQKQESKIKFGISSYGKSRDKTSKLGLAIKKELKNKSINSRLVTSKGKNLSSVVVETNKLTTKGIEIILGEHQDKTLIGKTLAVQPFKELSYRDYGRPRRDDHSGMLPPKLAQIMLNLARGDKNETLLDPFCGSGTILTEAILTGYKKVIGTDNSSRAVSDAQKNLDWIAEQYNISSYEARVFPEDCTRLSEHFSPRSIKTIVTEPYLGPQRGEYDREQTARDLEKLYSRCLQELKKILKKEGRMVIIFPIFTDKKGGVLEYIKPDLSGFHLIKPLSSELTKNCCPKTTDRNTIVYGRPQQKVWREVVILKPKAQQ